MKVNVVRGGEEMLYEEPSIEVMNFVAKETITTNLGLSSNGEGDEFVYDFF